tara:strand:+ start:1640 stop:1966 length:327 start_codon:yes stop_codon:yes gene_type:complete
MDDFLKHAEHIIHLVGEDYLSLGLDYYTGQWPYVSDEAAIANYNDLVARGVWNVKNYPKPPHKYVSGIETPDKIMNLKSAFLKRSFTESAIDKIMGKNLLRVFSDVWK